MFESEVCGEGNERGCHFTRFQVGELDTSGRRIEQIVYLEPNKYIIYFVEGEYLRPFYMDAYDFFAPFSSEFQKKLSQILSINVRNEKKNEFIRREMASAYNNALNGYNDIAVGELEVLRGKLIYRAYVWWFTSYVMLCSLLTIISITLHLVSNDVPIKNLVYAINASSVGGVLAHTRKESKEGITPFLPIIAAYICFFASVVSGFLVYCILKTNLILGGLGEDYYTIILLCFVAGYSEDIPLKLIDKISGFLDTSRGTEKKENKQ